MVDAGKGNADAGAPAPSAIASELLALVLNRPTAYSAMSEAIAALSGLGMDETTRYRAAFAVLKKTQQRTVEQIAQAIDVHLGLLQAERDRFASQSRAAENDQIAARRASIERLNAEVNANTEAMTRLRTETETRLQQMQATQVQKQAEAAALAKQVDAEQHNIERTTRDFATAASSIEQFLNQERNRLRERLAGEG